MQYAGRKGIVGDWINLKFQESKQHPKVSPVDTIVLGQNDLAKSQKDRCILIIPCSSEANHAVEMSY